MFNYFPPPLFIACTEKCRCDIFQKWQHYRIIKAIIFLRCYCLKLLALLADPFSEVLLHASSAHFFFCIFAANWAEFSFHIYLGECSTVTTFVCLQSSTLEKIQTPTQKGNKKSISHLCYSSLIFYAQRFLKECAQSAFKKKNLTHMFTGEEFEIDHL